MVESNERRSVTPPLSHRPFAALLGEGLVKATTSMPDREHVELPKRRIVVPSWQQETESTTPASSEVELDVQGARPPSEQLELPNVKVEWSDVDVHVNVEINGTSETPLARWRRGREKQVPKKGKKNGSEHYDAVMKRADAILANKRAGKPYETYADIGKDYGLNAQGVANLVSRLRKRALSTNVVESKSVSNPAAVTAAKTRSMALRFDRAVEVTIVGLDEYITAKVKEGVALALRKGIG